MLRVSVIVFMDAVVHVVHVKEYSTRSCLNLESCHR
jgi:hypothetical protein